MGCTGADCLAKPRRYSVADLDDRLVRCISSAFPGLTDREIRTVDVERLADVDSLAAVTLVALIDQEFGVNLDLEDLLKCGNFAELCQYLHDQPASSEAVNTQRVK
jgi:acyl carrier protein